MTELVALARTGADAVASLRAVWDRGDAVVLLDPRLPPAARSLTLDALAPTRLIDERGCESPLEGGRPCETGDALVVTTSGSSGIPKGVVHTHASLRASAVATSEALAVDPDTDRWLCCLPLSHIAGLAVVVRALVVGTELEVHPRFDADAVADAARRGATLTSLVPTALARIDPSIFRRVVLGGSTPPSETPSNCTVTYGMTETGSGVVYDGRPLDGVEVRILDGEILLRGPMLMRGYRDGTTSIDAAGWLHTDDLGALDDDGRLTVHGRRGDMIVTGGEKVWPAPVERALSGLEAVAEVAVVGRHDDEWGHAVTAVVVPRDPRHPPRLDELRDKVRATLPAYCAPRRLELVSTLPRTPLGKVARRQLTGG